MRFYNKKQISDEQNEFSIAFANKLNKCQFLFFIREREFFL